MSHAEMQRVCYTDSHWLQTQLVLMLLTEKCKGFKAVVSIFARLIRRLTMRHMFNNLYLM